MRIADLFRQNQGVDQSAVRKHETVQRQSEEESARQAKAAKANGEDSISISPLARQLATVQKVLTEDEIAQQRRVQEIKERVEAGTYNVSSTDVAGAIASFATE